MKRTIALILAAVMLAAAAATAAAIQGSPDALNSAQISPRITLTSSDGADAAGWLDARLGDKLRDASTNRRHHQRTIEEFNRLGDEFTIDDVANSFHVNINAARMRVKRLLKDGVVAKCGEYVENGTCKHRYKKKAILVI